MPRRLDRRTFLRGAGGIAIGLPFLDAFIPTGRAAVSPGPKRFVVFFSPNGTLEEAFRPQGGETDFSFTRSDGGRHILEPLAPHRDDLIVAWGIDMKSREYGPGGNGHDLGMGHMLTARELLVGPSGVGNFSHLPDGSAGGISIDQEVAHRIGGETPFPSFEFGVQARLYTSIQVTCRMSYQGPFEPVPPENDPAAAFATLFSEFGADAEALARLRARRQSVLDKVKDDFTRVNAQLGSADRQKLESHLEAIREIEQQLDFGDGGNALEGCAKPPEPSVAYDQNDNFPVVGKAQMDLLVMALACDLTRVASLQWSTAQSGTRFSWLGHSGNHHSMSHEADDDPGIRNQLIDINYWYAQQFAYLLNAMKSIPEGDGTMLDNSVVLWINEQGNGDRHTRTDIPVVLAGSAGGYFRTGRSLLYQDQPHNDLFVSILHAMGQDDVTTFGIEELCSGPLAGLT